MTQINELKDKESFSTKKILKSNKLLTTALAFVLVAGMASPAFALVVDTFDNPTFALTANTGTPTDTITNTEIPDGPLIAIGDARIVTVEHVGGANDVMIQMNSDGFMSLSSDAGQPGTQGDFIIIWDANTAGLGGLDLTEGSGDRIIVTLAEADANADFTVILTDKTNGFLLTHPGIMTVAGPDELMFLFADFVGTGDITDIDKIELRITGELRGDYDLDKVDIPQRIVGGTVGSMSTTSLLVAGVEANMGLWSLALVGAVAIGAAVTYKVKSKKTKQ